MNTGCYPLGFPATAQYLMGNRSKTLGSQISLTSRQVKQVNKVNQSLKMKFLKLRQVPTGRYNSQLLVELKSENVSSSS